MWNLRKYLRPYWKAAVLAPLLMLLEVAMDLQQPRLMAEIVNRGVLPGDLPYIQRTGLLMAGVALVGLLGGLGCNLFAGVAALSFAADVREALFAKIQSFSFRDLDRFKTGSLITRLTNDVVQLQGLVQTALQMLVRAPLICIGSLIMALDISPRLGLILLIAIPVLLAVVSLLVRLAYPLFAAVQTRLDAVNTVVQENLAGIRVVKAFARAEYETRRFGQANDNYTAGAMRAARVIALNMPLMTLIMNTTIVAVLWYGGHPAWSGPLPIGDLIAFINYVTQVLGSLLMVSMILMNISQARVSADRVGEVLAREAEIRNAVPHVRGTPARGGVVFEHVGFAYGGGSAPALRDIDFEVRPGETVAILGATGSGKSTLVHLIPRLYDPTEGRVWIDGVDVREMDLRALRGRIGVVLQESILFTGTVRDNIRFGRPEASQDEVEAVARAAQAHEFIAALPEGYDTPVGQRGVGLSGGQKQRLAIARALLLTPAILILDDSTSAVDFDTEARLRRALRERLHGTTTFVIAQRVASVLDADRILVLDEGRLVGQGIHADLLRDCPVYRDIHRSQFGEEVVVGA